LTREQDLPNCVVDLVGTGVTQVLALQVDLCTAKLACHVGRERKRSLTADELGQMPTELPLELRVDLGGGIPLGQFVEGGNEGLGNKTPSVGTEMAPRICCRNKGFRCHFGCLGHGVSVPSAPVVAFDVTPVSLTGWKFSSGPVQLHAEAMGDGPAVLLLHGFSSSFRRNWHGTGWTKALAQAGRRAAGLDFRGHGRSAKSDDPDFYTPRILCEDIALLQDQLGETCSDLVGFSMGAAIALQFAILNPKRVRRLVLAGVGDKILPTNPPPTEPATIAAAMRETDPLAHHPPIARRFRHFAERGGNDLGALAAMMSGPGWPGRVDIPGTVSCPTLVLLAEADEFMPQADRLRAFLPNATFEILPGTDHIGLSADPRFLTRSLAFLNAAG